METKNRYEGDCNACGAHVKPRAGYVERRGRRWLVWCISCYDKSDHSSYEDRACGDRAYEDRCFARVNY